jgi:hypothetical protein
LEALAPHEPIGRQTQSHRRVKRGCASQTPNDGREVALSPRVNLINSGSRSTAN